MRFLAVAYQYTIGEKVYQVGEFANDGLAATDVEVDRAYRQPNRYQSEFSSKNAKKCSHQRQPSYLGFDDEKYL